MRFDIAIDYPLEEMDKSWKRMEDYEAFRQVERVPVGFCLAPRFFMPLLKVPYQTLFADAETQYQLQLQFLKYRLENIPEDLLCTGTTVSVLPYFDNVVEADACGAEVLWSNSGPPRAHPSITTVEQMAAFEMPEPDAGLWGKMRDWWFQMKDLTEQTRITFAGGEGKVEVGLLGLTGMGPHMTAIDLVGQDFYWWQLEHPEACHDFLKKIALGMIQAQKYFKTLDSRPRNGVSLAEDSAQIMSQDQFRQFAVPYDNMIYEALSAPGANRGMHMCGVSTHLHEALVQDLKITSFNIFGYQVAPEVAARNLGGRTRLWGNINPMLMLNGSAAEVKQECMEAIRALAPCGGFLLGDGANVCPGTPLENLRVFTEAAEEYSLRER